MALEWITEPISDDAPCGPNLDATDDAEFVDYYFDAMGRLPDPYFTPGVNTGSGQTPDKLFDPKSVDWAAESEAIEGLLHKSRDIRLLALRAQWAVLAGRLPDMADSVRAIADALESFGADLHPEAHSGIQDRRDALGELGSRDAIQLPLMYCGLTGTTDVTVRRMRVAEGRYTAGDGESDVNAGSMRSMLASADSAAQVGRSHAALMTLADAFNRIIRNCKLNDGFNPDFGETINILNEMRGLITDARPDLRGAEADLEPAEAEDGAGDAEGAATDGGEESGGTTTMVVQNLPPSAIRSHAEARQALLTCEVYFRAKEPSSAALLLVVQARLLIGKSLMEAMQILLPAESQKAIVSFGPQTGFALPVDKLRQLSAEVPNGAPVQPPEVEEVGDPPVVTNTGEAAAALKGVEDFFRRSEKSSPVPILLQRARSYLDKDFQALMSELIPAAPAAPAAPAQ